MRNCSIEAKQNVISLYHKGYSLFSISKATSVPKSTCWDIFEDIIPADMLKIEKFRVERKIWILKRKRN